MDERESVDDCFGDLVLDCFEVVLWGLVSGQSFGMGRGAGWD